MPLPRRRLPVTMASRGRLRVRVVLHSIVTRSLRYESDSVSPDMIDFIRPKYPRCRTLGVAASAFLLLLTGFATGAMAREVKAVVELFTSQGCSSCPPADKLLGELAERDDVIALTLPVDYWDYLGWKDTLASPAYTKRQEAYARRRGDRQVYTPQMVVNGRMHVIGSHRDRVLDAIVEANASPDVWIDVGLSVDRETIMVSAAAAPADSDTPDATVWLLLTSKSEEVNISRGENGGRSITYSNVVRMMMPVGSWSGDAIEISLPRADLMEGYDGCAVLLQVDGAGPLLGASFLDGTDLTSN